MTQRSKITPQDIQSRKGTPEPIVSLTAYSKAIAETLDPFVDLFIVGDSVGMVLYGMENTLGVTLEMMIAHGKAVMRANPRACVVVDMPYGTYENSADQALEAARRIMRETGCDAVKLEGGADMAPTIAHLVQNNIPVMAHIGLMPQSVEKEGGYKIKGKTPQQCEALLEDARAVEKAGAFSAIVEGTVHEVADKLTAHISIPTIGIGASAACDGQVLVTEDMLGVLHENPPKFVKQYVNIKDVVAQAAKAYAADVKSRRFPAAENLYNNTKKIEKIVGAL